MSITPDFNYNLILSPGMAHRKQGYRFENDYTYESRKERAEKIWKSAVIIPVNVDIKAEHLVLNLDKAKEYLINARKIAVLDCECRVEFQHCEAPLDVCVSLNDRADVHLVSDDFKDYHPREVSVDEALDVLKKAHEAGLVLLAYSLGEDREPDDVGVICSCCSCCCHDLQLLKDFGRKYLIAHSDYIARTKMELCSSCGICYERCVFGARQMKDINLCFSAEACYGCGLCVTSCPTEAISMELRKKEKEESYK